MRNSDAVQLDTRNVKRDMRQGQCDILYLFTTREPNPREFRILIEIKGGYAPGLLLQMEGDDIESARREVGEKPSKLRHLSLGLLLAVNLGLRRLGAMTSSDEMMSRF